MKNSKKSRSQEGSKSPNYSTKKNQQHSSLRGLITKKQQSIKTESEVSEYTQRTNKTNTFANSQDFDIVDDDFDKEEAREVFVSEQEEKVIHKILEVARKGKINQKNAFQIPLKVLDNERFTIGKTKFWKFASELLEASMSIYEKRIQNTWLNTNLIHDKLARMTVQKRNESQNQQRDGNQRRNNQDYMLLSLQQFRDPKILDNIRIGSQTLEAVEKINIPRVKQQFTNDPLFQRKLKAFDNNSLKGLLINIFDLKTTCQIELFSDQNRFIEKDKSSMIKNQSYFPSQQKYFEKIIQQSKMNKDKLVIFKNVVSFTNDNLVQGTEKPGFDSVGFAANQDQNKQNIMNQLQSFLEDKQPLLQHHLSLYDDNFLSYQQSQQLKQFNEQELKTQNSQLLMHSSQEGTNTYSQESPIIFHSDGPFSYSDADRSFHSVMTPWQMEFKQGKLRKKSQKNLSRKNRETKTKQKIEAFSIQFDVLKVENKKITLKAKRDYSSKSTKGSKKKSNTMQNILPPQLAVYEKINYKKSIGIRRVEQNQVDKQNSKNINQNLSDLPDFLAPDPSMLELNEMQINNEAQNRESNQHFHENSSQQVVFFSSQQHQGNHRVYNIRETKKYLYEKVKQQRQIKISEINIAGLSPASALITFLHIANEKNMIVRNTANQDDVILSWQ